MCEPDFPSWFLPHQEEYRALTWGHKRKQCPKRPRYPIHLRGKLGKEPGLGEGEEERACKERDGAVDVDFLKARFSG